MIKRLLKRNLPAPFLHAVRSYKNREYNNLSPEKFLPRSMKAVFGVSQMIHLTRFTRAAVHVVMMKSRLTFNRSLPFYVPLQSNPTSSTSDVAISL
jgi:hypothetical protein